MEATTVLAGLISIALFYLVVAGLVLGYHAERPPRSFLADTILGWNPADDDRVIGWHDREHDETRRRAYLWPLAALALAMSGSIYAVYRVVRALLAGPRAIIRSAAHVGRCADASACPSLA